MTFEDPEVGQITSGGFRQLLSRKIRLLREGDGPIVCAEDAIYVVVAGADHEVAVEAFDSTESRGYPPVRPTGR